MAPQLPELFHIGWVVRDCEAAEAELTERLGAGPVHRIGEQSRFDQALVHGKPTAFALKIAFCRLGGTIVELLEPRDDRSPHAEFLARHGEGLHHLAYLVTDFDEQLAAARAADPTEPLLVDGTGPRNPIRWAYLDGAGLRGTVVELIERSAAAEAAFGPVLQLLA